MRNGLSTEQILGTKPRMIPGPELDPNTAKIFAELTASVAPDHLRESDRPILTELARAIVVCREAWEQLQSQGLVDGNKPNPWLRILREQQKLVATLATRCRLTAQSRISKDRASRTGVPAAGPLAALAYLEGRES